jgi:hypothetical protein
LNIGDQKNEYHILFQLKIESATMLRTVGPTTPRMADSRVRRARQTTPRAVEIESAATTSRMAGRTTP